MGCLHKRGPPGAAPASAGIRHEAPSQVGPEGEECGELLCPWPGPAEGLRSESREHEGGTGLAICHWPGPATKPRAWGRPQPPRAATLPARPPEPRTSTRCFSNPPHAALLVAETHRARLPSFSPLPHFSSWPQEERQSRRQEPGLAIGPHIGKRGSGFLQAPGR